MWGGRWNFGDISFHSGDRGTPQAGRRVCDSKIGRRPKVKNVSVLSCVMGVSVKSCNVLFNPLLLGMYHECQHMSCWLLEIHYQLKIVEDCSNKFN